MSHKRKKIGILGGIGPEATGNFYLGLISKLQKRGIIKSNQDFPQIIINSIPASELIHSEISKKELNPYITGLKELENMGANLIVMVCNTIHLFHERLQKKVSVPILYLPEEIKTYLKRKKIKSSTLLGTPLVIKSGLYEFQGIHNLRPTRKEIESLSKLIFDFNKGYKKDRRDDAVVNLAKKYLNKGAKNIIAGCTEIALMLKNQNLPILDPMEIAQESAIKFYLS